MSGTSVGYSWSGSLITTTDARMRAWDLASQIRRARRLARRHTIIACRSAFESSRSRCWAGCIMSTDWNPLREAGHEIGRRLFLRITTGETEFEMMRLRAEALTALCTDLTNILRE